VTWSDVLPPPSWQVGDGSGGRPAAHLDVGAHKGVSIASARALDVCMTIWGGINSITRSSRRIAAVFKEVGRA